MNVYEMVAESFIKEMENGKIPWKQPWFGTRLAVDHIKGKPYSLLNQLLLGEPGEYLTFNQVKKEGGSVKKGAKAKFVVFWKFLKVETDLEDENGKKIFKEVPFLRYYNVFHINQTEGIKEKHPQGAKESNLTPDETAQALFDEYITRERITVHKDRDNAYYRPTDDSIGLPDIKRFTDISEYYSTAFHEAIHSTGAKSRLDRLESTHFGSDAYSKEELVAEIGSSMLLNMVGMNTEESFKNNVAYVQNWLSHLKDDVKLIVGAASKAEKAVQFLKGEKESTLATEVA